VPRWRNRARRGPRRAPAVRRPAARRTRRSGARPRTARAAGGWTVRLRGAVRIVGDVQRRRYPGAGGPPDARPARRGVGQPPPVGCHAAGRSGGQTCRPAARMDRLLIVPAAGRGSRLGSRAPKALVPVAGVPMLDHLLTMHQATVDRFIVVVAPEAITAFTR